MREAIVGILDKHELPSVAVEILKEKLFRDHLNP